MDNGWIKIYRSILDWEWASDDFMFRFFITLLLNANYEDKKWRGMTIKRGQYLTSQSQLCEKFGKSRGAIRYAVSKLESTGEIEISTTNRFSIITICNYESYQGVENGQQPTSNQQNSQPSNQRDCEFATNGATNEQQGDNSLMNGVSEDVKNNYNQRSSQQKASQATSRVATTKEYKNIRNKEYISKEKKEEKKESGAETSSAPPLQKNKSNVFIPPEIDEVKKYCEERGNGIDPNSFIDFYASKGWMIGKNKMKDWRAAVRTWERRNNQTSRDGNGNRYKSARDREIEDRLTRGAIVYDPSQPKIPNKL